MQHHRYGLEIKHKGKRAVHGFKAHLGINVNIDLADEVSVTSTNTYDGEVGLEALPNNSGEVFADSAYRGNHIRDAVRAKNAIPRSSPRLAASCLYSAPAGDREWQLDRSRNRHESALWFARSPLPSGQMVLSLCVIGFGCFLQAA